MTPAGGAPQVNWRRREESCGLWHAFISWTSLSDIRIRRLPLCRIEKNEDGTLTVHYKGKDGEEKSLVAGLVMFGTGRKPNTNRLNIEVRSPFL